MMFIWLAPIFAAAYAAPVWKAPGLQTISQVCFRSLIIFNYSCFELLGSYFNFSIERTRTSFVPEPTLRQVLFSLFVIFFSFSQTDGLKDDVKRWAQENAVDITPLFQDDLATFFTRVGYQ